MLTSLNDGDLKIMGFNGGTRETALNLARLAQDAGVSGVVASAEDAAAIRKACGGEFLIVTPGIRGAKEVAGDDQKRIVTPCEAVTPAPTTLWWEGRSGRRRIPPARRMRSSGRLSGGLRSGTADSSYREAASEGTEYGGMSCR